MFDDQMARECRRQFPGLQRCGSDGRPAVFLDGPAGTQVPEVVIAAMGDYYALLDEALQALADFVGASDAREIVFGQNMTSLTFQLSRSLAQTWSSGDEIVVTRLDHDANISPWVLAARERGVTVRFIDIREDDATLNLDQLQSVLCSRTKLVAVGCASNATGGINPVRDICRWAQAVGALTFVDAVHYGPHGLIDIAEWGCDFLVCSTYKFFGPHLGVLWGRSELLESLPAYKVRPACNDIPWRWMTGTQSHEAIAGALACVDYLAGIGRTALGQDLPRRAALREAFVQINRYETELVWRLIDGLVQTDGVRVYGITDRTRAARRVATVSLVHRDIPAGDLSRELGARNIYTWAGHYYALELVERLGLLPDGMLRLGLVHYNTAEEVDRCLEEIRAIVESRMCV